MGIRRGEYTRKRLGPQIQAWQQLREGQLRSVILRRRARDYSGLLGYLRLLGLSDCFAEFLYCGNLGRS
ncbi:MAG: hypothetical protein DMG79_09115 [Acidobacteria bacterium]|nr:MAG: hypothetical protein DMG79_09115 [Acidobacteriota bacterium]